MAVSVRRLSCLESTVIATCNSVHTTLPLARCTAITPSMLRGNPQDGHSLPAMTAVLKQSWCDSLRQHGRVATSLQRCGVLQLPSQKMQQVEWRSLRYLEILIQQNREERHKLIIATELSHINDGVQ